MTRIIIEMSAVFGLTYAVDYIFHFAPKRLGHYVTFGILCIISSEVNKRV